MSTLWDRVRQLEGATLAPLHHDKPFTVFSVLEDSVRLLPQDGTGSERSVRRDQIEHIAGLGVSREELRQRAAREFPGNQNTSYIAAIASAVAQADPTRTVPAPPIEPRDEWERQLLALASDCGVSLSDEALSREALYD